MADQAKLLQRMMGNKQTKDVLHSSGYAQVQNGANFGSASIESFQARQSIEQNRKFVQGYRNAQIMRSAYGVERARTLIPGTKDSKSGNSRLGQDARGEASSGRSALISNRGNSKDATTSSRASYLRKMDSMRSGGAPQPASPPSRMSQISASFKPNFK